MTFETFNYNLIILTKESTCMRTFFNLFRTLVFKTKSETSLESFISDKYFQ